LNHLLSASRVAWVGEAMGQKDSRRTIVLEADIRWSLLNKILRRKSVHTLLPIGVGLLLGFRASSSEAAPTDALPAYLQCLASFNPSGDFVEYNVERRMAFVPGIPGTERGFYVFASSSAGFVSLPSKPDGTGEDGAYYVLKVEFDTKSLPAIEVTYEETAPPTVFVGAPTRPSYKHVRRAKSIPFDKTTEKILADALNMLMAQFAARSPGRIDSVDKKMTFARLVKKMTPCGDIPALRGAYDAFRKANGQ
jgi:hypothetical protein